MNVLAYLHAANLRQLLVNMRGIALGCDMVGLSVARFKFCQTLELMSRRESPEWVFQLYGLRRRLPMKAPKLVTELELQDDNPPSVLEADIEAELLFVEEVRHEGGGSQPNCVKQRLNFAGDAETV